LAVISELEFQYQRLWQEIVYYIKQLSFRDTLVTFISYFFFIRGLDSEKIISQEQFILHFLMAHL
jgi:hypothetical protein